MRHGFTLLESVIAFALLFLAFLILIALYHNGLRLTGQIQQQQQAALVGERQLDALRAYGGNLTNYRNWAPMLGTIIVPDAPDMQVTTTISNVTLYSSGSSVELGLLGPQQRLLAQSCVQARVRVTWANGSRQLNLHSLIAEPDRPPRAVNPVVVTPVTAVPNPLPRDQSQQFTATAYDTAGNVVSDVTFAWDVLPVTGNCLVNATRPGTVGNLTNRLIIPNPLGPLTIYTGGRVLVQARATVGGHLVSGRSNPVVLQP